MTLRDRDPEIKLQATFEVIINATLIPTFGISSNVNKVLILTQAAIKTKPRQVWHQNLIK